MKEPWWKRRIKQSIIEIQKYINILERRKRGETIKESKYIEVSKKYSVMKKGISNVIEELKQRLQAKTYKLNRYEKRVRQYQINRMFQHDQKKVYQQLQSCSRIESQSPTADDSRKFWSDIWDNKRQHNKRAELLEELRNNKPSVLLNDIEITTRMVKQQVKMIPNWKAPGPDGVQRFWIKKLTSLHERITSQLNDVITNEKEIPS